MLWWIIAGLLIIVPLGMITLGKKGPIWWRELSDGAGKFFVLGAGILLLGILICGSVIPKVTFGAGQDWISARLPGGAQATETPEEEVADEDPTDTPVPTATLAPTATPRPTDTPVPATPTATATQIPESDGPVVISDDDESTFRVVYEPESGRIWQDLMPLLDQPSYSVEFVAPWSGSGFFNGVEAALSCDSVELAARGDHLQLELKKDASCTVVGLSPNGAFEIVPEGYESDAQDSICEEIDFVFSPAGNKYEAVSSLSDDVLNLYYAMWECDGRLWQPELPQAGSRVAFVIDGIELPIGTYRFSGVVCTLMIDNKVIVMNKHGFEFHIAEASEATVSCEGGPSSGFEIYYVP